MTTVPSGVSAIVLAGGRSRRFGRDKLAVDLGGRSLLVHAVEAVAGICQETIVVIGASGAVPDGLPAAIRIARDAEDGGGPLVGLIAGLEAAVYPSAVVVGGDMPGVRPSVLGLLAAVLMAGKTDGVVLDGASLGGPTQRPMPCAVRRETALAAARESLAEGDRSLRGWLDRLSVSELPEARWRPLDPAAESLRDVDRPEDLPGPTRPSRRRPRRSRFPEKP